MGRPRVLLVDDDASIRRFVAMALEDLEIDLLEAGSVPEALARLGAGGPVQLLLTDLMMRGESGFDLLQALAGAPSLRGHARLVVLSAGLDAVSLGRLAALGVAQALRKPFSVDELVTCVHNALGLVARNPLAPDAQSCDDATLNAAEAVAVQRHFGGDSALFLSFRASCRAQFQRDLIEGRAAIDQVDVPALRRLAHSLKSVLATLGLDDLSVLARHLEAAASEGNWQQAVPLWAHLQEGLAPHAVDDA